MKQAHLNWVSLSTVKILFTHFGSLATQVRQKLRLLGKAKLWVVIASIGICGSVFSHVSHAQPPWRLQDFIPNDSGFSVSGSHRLLFENVSDSVRINNSRNDQVLNIRTLIDARYSNNGFTAQIELMDSRAELVDVDSIIGTATVDTRDVLQASINYSWGNAESSRSTIKLGRYTADWGSRRFMARNRFRNTLNSFDGLEWVTQWQNGVELKIMANRPVRRLPTDRPSILDNQHASDKSSEAAKLFAVSATFPKLVKNASTELYLYDLREKDSSDVATANRRIQTAGLRIVRAPSPGQYHFEIESTIQHGQRHASASPVDLTQLDHLAFSQHLMFGYTFDEPHSTRLLLELDYASGDDNPFDNDSERFDPLFGVSTFDFGPVGIYGAFNRSNIITPGLRLTSNVNNDIDLMFSYRHFWLDSRSDSWGRTSVRDLSGQVDSYLGQHFESRLRWNLVPGNIRLQMGAVFLKSENSLERNSQYVYLGTEFFF